MREGHRRCDNCSRLFDQAPLDTETFICLECRNSEGDTNAINPSPVAAINAIKFFAELEKHREERCHKLCTAYIEMPLTTIDDDHSIEIEWSLCGRALHVKFNAAGECFYKFIDYVFDKNAFIKDFEKIKCNPIDEVILDTLQDMYSNM